MIFRFGLTFLICSLQAISLWAQGTFIAKQYDAEITGGHRQNWAISQDSSGYLYFGNQTAGILRFDGTDWTSKHVPTGGTVRSLIQFESETHWGGVGNFGVIESDQLSQYTPKSFLNLLDTTHHAFTDVWKMLKYKNKLYHRTSNKLFVFDEDTVQVLNSNKNLVDFFHLDDRFLLHYEKRELGFLEDEKMENIPGSDLYSNDRLVAVFPGQGGYILISRNQGFVRFDGENFEPLQSDVDEYIKDHSVYRGTQIHNSKIALATLSGGIVITDKEGNLQKVLTEDNDLPTNIIYELYVDNEKTLWAATDDGIAKILVNNPVTVVNDGLGFRGIPTFIEAIEGRVYFGSTEGLFYMDHTGSIKQQSEIYGRVYDGVRVEDKLFITTPDGLYEMSSGMIDKISEQVYNQLKAVDTNNNTLVGISAKTVDQISFTETNMEYKRIWNGNTSVRDIHFDENGLWIITHQNKVYFKKRRVDNAVKQYEVFIPDEAEFRQLGVIGGKLRLATDAGLFMYDKQLNSFQRDSTFNDSDIINQQVFRFKQCSDNEIWFRNNQKIKRSLRQGNSWITEETSYYTIGSNGTIQQIHCNNDGSIWFGGSEGIFHLSDPDWTYDHNFNTNITGVLIHNDSLIYGGYGDPAEIKELKFEENELRFTYAAASYIDPEANEYRTRLSGYEDEWSDWSGEPQKDYTFIPEGTYTFEVQGRNVYHKTGSIDSYTFTVLPPWYRTIWAYLGYLLLAGGMVYAGHRIRINSILKEQKIRDGIARDLHDELSSTLSSISFFANAMDSPKPEVEKENRYLSLIKKSSLEAKEKISDIVWVIHTENDDWENLLMRCKRFASDILDARDIEHNFEIKGTFNGKPTITQKKNIWLIFREIITNIARHAEATQVDIRFSRDARNLHIHIEDNGKGFDPDNTREGGYGVQNIKERANQMRGKCALESMPGEGTRWVIDIPVG